MLPPLPMTTQEAFDRYEAVRPRLPQMPQPVETLYKPSLSEIADLWDGFILDAFGVLNVGTTPIESAIGRMAELRARGKKLCVLTNGSSAPRHMALAKYRKLGFDFTADEVVSSRDVANAALENILPNATWGAISMEGDDFSDLSAKVIDLKEGGWEKVDGVLFLCAARFDEQMRDRLHHAMRDCPRPIVVANPDLIAPHEWGFSIEPGFWTHELLDMMQVPNHWYGKPFLDGFKAAAAKTGLAMDRLAMVGDTLHTDILGGKAAGMGAILVSDHGLFAGHDVRPFIKASGITPDAVVATT